MNTADAKQHVQHPQPVDQRAANRPRHPHTHRHNVDQHAKRKKYQELSKRVKSILFAFGELTAFWAFVYFQVGWFAKGLPFAEKSTSSGRVIGKSGSGTGTAPHLRQ